MIFRRLIPVSLVFAAGCAQASAKSNGMGLPVITTAVFQRLVPTAEHHAHLVSPITAPMANEPPLEPIALPAAIVSTISALENGWNDSSAIAGILADDAIVYNGINDDLPTWIVGRPKVASYLAERFSRAYRLTPVAFSTTNNSAEVAGYLRRTSGTSVRYFSHVMISLKQNGAEWKIVVFVPVSPGPPARSVVNADTLIAQLNSAGIKHAAVLSVAYWYGSPFGRSVSNEYESVKAENDWVAAEVTRFPDRLVAFCSFNPLKDYALQELERCAKNPAFRGVKLHFGNSGVELLNPDHVERLRRVFRAANDHGLALVVHLFTGPEYEVSGGKHARVFIDKLLPEAPDVPVQIAHMAGGGRATDSALAVYASAIAANDPRTRNLYFDVATLTGGETRAGLERVAMRMRQIGLRRILFGTDMSPPNPSPGDSWDLFRAKMPLTDAEMRIIAGNVAPYFAGRSACCRR